MSASPAPLITGVDHYENFPVASVLVPASLRPAVVALYGFARFADDVADEGDAPPEARYAHLDHLAHSFDPACGAPHPVVARLIPYLRRHRIAPAECLSLLSAFRQDVGKHRYETADELADYCARSADPVGRLMLGLFGCRNADTEPLSDAICSALQLINFLQDLAIDWRRGRLYLPLQALRARGLDEHDVERAVATGRCQPPLREALAAQARRTGALLESGAGLVRLVPRRLAWEVRATLAGGRRILEQLSAGGYDPVARRPSLGWQDAPAFPRLMFSPARLA